MKALLLGLALAAGACGARPVAGPDAGGTRGRTSSTTPGGTSTGSGTSGGATAGSTSQGGSSGGGSSGACSTVSGAGQGILAGTVGFTVAFEGEFSHHFPDGGSDPASLVVILSDYDFSPYCGLNPDGGFVYLPNPVGGKVAVVTVETDGGPLGPATYAISADAQAVLQGAPGAAVTEGTEDQPYDVASSGSVTLQAVQCALASGHFQATLLDADGGLAGTLSGSFSPDPCPGAGYWR